MSAIQGYLMTMSAPFLFATLRVRRVNPHLVVSRLRVAFVVTKAPSEPWSIVRTTLEAMLAQNYPYPYDTWLCDEQPLDDTRAWCGAHGVSISSRYGSSEYHQPRWPRRTRCKEGNLSYFYDHWGYRCYDVVSQLDADHVPGRQYLTEMVRPFSDPRTGYVAAPSVCDANASSSWAARGRLYREATFHGAYQAAHNDGLAPVCIGSHYTVRTAALAEIGGIGPELAEDFTTSLLLSGAGWSGVFALDAEAHGLGPSTLAAMLTQEFQWSRSLMAVLLSLFRHNVGRLAWLQRVRFAYSLSYYPGLAVVMGVALCISPVACLTGVQWYRVNYYVYLAFAVGLAAPLMGLFLLLRSRGLLRPERVPFLSWEHALFVLARWPYVAWGVVAALLVAATGRTSELKVTPKGETSISPLSWRLVAPYALIALLMSAAVLGGVHHVLTELPLTQGYAALSLLGGSVYAVVTFALPALHVVEGRRASGVSLSTALRAVRGAVALSFVALAAIAYAASVTLPMIHLLQI